MEQPPASEPENLRTPALDTRWDDTAIPNLGRVRLALSVALAVHLLVIWIAAGGLEALFVGQRGAAPKSAAPKPIGDLAGVLDGVAAEIIDAAELDKRYISFRAGRAAADSEAAAAAAKSQPQPPSPPPSAIAEQPAKDIPGEGEQPAQPKTRKPEPSDRAVLTQAEMAELLASTMEDLQGGAVAVAAPGAARLGDASPFVRSVIRILKQTMPRGLGVKGSVTIQLVVSEAGTVEAIRVVKSSGRPDLDRLILERVGATRLAVPARDTPMRERMLQITYDYN